MQRVRQLSEELIGKIAAGEVVERPASVVKELVENSIDARATEIVVDIASGGKERITVVDDGFGMSEQDARMSLQRHATSKISKEDDLFAIATLGFRGEAMPSIAAVSRLTIETKEHGVLDGTRLLVDGGRLLKSETFGCADGTRIIVEDLFFNTPARKKFLRGDKTEEGHVLDVVSKLALSHPDVRFKFRADGREKLSCVSLANRKARLAEVLGIELASMSKEFEEKNDGIRISGFLGNPDAARRVSQGIYIFINGRFIRDRLVTHAITDGYRGLLPTGAYPFAVIFLTIDPARIDVNVHPTKQEVRFENTGAIHGFVAAAVRKSVQRREAVQQGNNPYAKVLADATLEADEQSSSFSNRYAQAFASGYLRNSASFAKCSRPAAATLDLIYKPLDEGRQYADASVHPVENFSGETSLSAERFASLKVIGQLGNSYILCEGVASKLVAIDQHAAHERIGFEILKRQLAEGGISSQRLLLPIQIELQPKDAAVFHEHVEKLNTLGFEIEHFGGRTYVIKSVPALLADCDVTALAFNLAREFGDIGASSSSEELTEHILKTIACHRQVRAGEDLSFDEMRALLSEMDRHPNADYCPHGRPSFVEFKADEIAKWFKRT